jgi:hypothetical protein
MWMTYPWMCALHEAGLRTSVTLLLGNFIYEKLALTGASFYSILGAGFNSDDIILARNSFLGQVKQAFLMTWIDKLGS